MGTEHAIQAALGLFQAGRAEDAKRSLRQHLQRSARDVNANKLLAMIHAELHEDAQALFFIGRAAELAPGDEEIQFMLANTQFLMGRHSDAEKVLRRLVERNPGSPQGADLLAKILITRGELDQAVQFYQRAVGAAPRQARLYSDITRILQEVGRVDLAVPFLMAGLGACPDDRALLAQACYSLNFIDADPGVHLELHRRLGRAAAPGGAAPVVFTNPPDPDRPLRVAMVSSDFKDHACATFMMPLVTNLACDGCLLYFYANVDSPDDWTRRFAQIAPCRDISGMDHESLAALARADAIDIIVDVNGWTAGTSLHRLAPRVAPVQATWLGYPNTTGVTSIDYALVDSTICPPGSEAQWSERPLRIDGCFLCYAAPEGAPGPERRREPGDDAIVFGSFNRLSKLSPRAVELWARVLSRVPGSRLLLKSRVHSGQIAAEHARLFGAYGVPSERLRSIPWADSVAHLRGYAGMDIALDSFPYNGTTTTCEALWMGVPVMTIRGDSFRARVSESILHGAGLDEFVGRDASDFVERCVRLAGDAARLAELRTTLRPRLAASRLTDGAAFAHAFRAALRHAWREWCARAGDMTT